MNDKIKFKIDEKGEYCLLLLDEQLKGVLLEDILAELKNSKIIFGIKKNIIEEAIAGKFSLEKNVIIARSVPPTTGQDEYIEYLIKDTPAIVSTPDKDNAVDFYETGFIKNVAIDTNLAEIHPPTAGNDGMNIFGQVLPGLPGHQIQIKKFLGNGVTVDDSGRFIKSSISGIYQKNYLGVISISDDLVIQGNLDFSVGNIDTTSNIHIKGDIKAGFVCKTTGNLTVEGAIEDALVEAGGNIICKSGILSGSRPIKADGIIKTNYIQERTIECADLSVESIVAGSSIRSTGKVKAKIIVGCNIISKTAVTADTIGNPENTRTTIKTGVDYHIIDKMEKTAQTIVRIKDDLKKNEQLLARLDEDYKNCAQKIVRISEIGTGNVRQSTVDEIISHGKEIYAELEKYKERNIILRSQADRLKKDYSALIVKVELTEPLLTVRDTIYPNTMITMRLNGTYNVKHIMQKVVFYINENNEILYREYIRDKT